ncbi:MAG: hypothetical protein MZU97_02075 [Bacillus subtilis]|nr:hypothetical protein [Bacillus subtilis]
MGTKVNQNDFPRISLKCQCGNEFDINVMRLLEENKVSCQICGQKFPVETGEKLSKALEDLYKVKYQLEKQDYPFHFSFIYKSTYPQPPIPYPIDKE